MEYILKSCEKASEKYQLKRISDKIELELKKVGKFAKANPELLKNGAREFSFTLYRLFTGTLEIFEFINIKKNKLKLNF